MYQFSLATSTSDGSCCEHLASTRVMDVLPGPLRRSPIPPLRSKHGGNDIPLISLEPEHANATQAEHRSGSDPRRRCDGRRRVVVLTLRSTTLSGRSNSPTMQRGMAPPHGLALSSLRSKRTVSMPFSCAKISAAQAPAGPPPTTATLYFMQSAEVDVGALTTFPVKEEAENAEAEVMAVATTAMEIFMVR